VKTCPVGSMKTTKHMCEQVFGELLNRQALSSMGGAKAGTLVLGAREEDAGVRVDCWFCWV
jgi:hypothetical protein